MRMPCERKVREFRFPAGRMARPSVQRRCSPSPPHGGANLRPCSTLTCQFLASR